MLHSPNKKRLRKLKQREIERPREKSEYCGSKFSEPEERPREMSEDALALERGVSTHRETGGTDTGRN